LTTSAPIESPACQMPNIAPAGSAITAIRPAVITSKGPAWTCPPSSAAFAAASSAFATVTYENQLGGTPAWRCWAGCAVIAAAGLPSTRCIE